MASLFDGFRSEIGRRPSGEVGRVLIAEDHAGLANIIAALLGHCGLDARTARDGRSALELARSFLPHFILLDVKLPGLDGYRVARLIRGDSSLEGTVIIAISAYRPAPGPGQPDPFDHYLVKPFELEALLALLKPGRSPRP